MILHAEDYTIWDYVIVGGICVFVILCSIPLIANYRALVRLRDQGMPEDQTSN